MGKAEEIVDLIISDIKERKGIGNEFESIDEWIQEEIKTEWTKIIKDKYTGGNDE